MSNAHSKMSTPSKPITFTLTIQRHGYCLKTTRSFLPDVGKAEALVLAAAYKRAFSDACDLYIFIRDRIEAEHGDDWPVRWNMKKMRTHMLSKGDAEEGTMIQELRSLFESDEMDGSRWRVTSCGFPLDAAGDVECDDELALDLERIK